MLDGIVQWYGRGQCLLVQVECLNVLNSIPYPGSTNHLPTKQDYLNPIELVKAGPRAGLGQPFEELPHGFVIQAVRAVEDHTLERRRGHQSGRWAPCFLLHRSSWPLCLLHSPSSPIFTSCPLPRQGPREGWEGPGGRGGEEGTAFPTCLAKALARSLVVSVLPVPAGPSGAPPRFSFRAPISVLGEENRNAVLES